MENKNKYSSAIIAGLIIMVFFIFFQYLSPIKGDAGRLLQGTLSLILRVVACYWIASLTKKQGRKALPYVLLGILIPAITLIIVGANGDKEEKKVSIH